MLHVQTILVTNVNQPRKSAKTLNVPTLTRIPAAITHPIKLALIIPVGEMKVDSGIEMSLPTK